MKDNAPVVYLDLCFPINRQGKLQVGLEFPFKLGD